MQKLWCIDSYKKMTGTSEWIRIWHEMVVAYIKVLPWFYMGSPRKITETLE
jgi:hypothetical protein